jgi:histidine triad (HIT) family protein
VSDHDCVFCDIVAGKKPGHVIMEDNLSMVILDIHPYSKGHCLAIPKRHVPWWQDMTDEETASLFILAKRAAERMMTAFRPEMVCMYARGRRIPHTHIFLIPTHGGDVLDRFFNAMERFQESPEELTRLKGEEMMREAAEMLREE